MATPHLQLAWPVVLGLLAALTWGAADFAGGLATRRTAPSRVVLIAHGISLALLAVLSLRVPAALGTRATIEGLASGVVGGAALMIFYEALALGAMGLPAALAGLLTALLPVLLSLHTEGLPGPWQLAGFALAALAILLIASAPSSTSAHQPRQRTPPRALVLATLSGFGFGFQLIWLHTAAAGGVNVAGPGPSVLRALMLSRLGGAAIALAVLSAGRLRPRGRLLPPVQPGAASRVPVFVIAITAGLLDSAGNAFYMASSLTGRLDVSAVLSSLYPGGTILLAALLLRERASRLQALGMGVALLAVALIAA